MFSSPIESVLRRFLLSLFGSTSSSSASSFGVLVKDGGILIDVFEFDDGSSMDCGSIKVSIMRQPSAEQETYLHPSGIEDTQASPPDLTPPYSFQPGLTFAHGESVTRILRDKSVVVHSVLRLDIAENIGDSRNQNT